MSRCLAVLALALLAGCGGKDPVATASEADEALRKGDAVAAQKLAEEGLALPGVAADNGTSWRLERVRLEALATKGEASTVLTEMERLAKTYAAPNQVNAAFYAKVARELVDAQKLLESLDLIEAGKQKFPKEVDKFDGLIAELEDRAKNGGNNELTSKLEQLGYAGGSKKKKPAAEPAKPATEPTSDMCSHCAGNQMITSAGNCESCGMVVDCCAACPGDQKLAASGTCPVCSGKITVKS